MENCKNIECKNKVTNTKYCSLGCRNIYVNKYLRDYNKLKITNEIKLKKRKDEYYLNPKLCINCGNVINFESKRNKTCSKLCTSENISKNNPSKQLNIKDKENKNLKIKNTHIKNNNNNNKLIINKKQICNYCQNTFNNKRIKKYCSVQCRTNKTHEKLTIKQKYKSLSNFKFALNKYPNEFDFKLVEQYGWYKAKNRGDNLNGVSRDHIISVNFGFDNNINPLLLAHPANCQLLKHTDNIRKKHKCDLSVDQLLNKILLWETKYGKYYNIEIETHI